MNTKRPQKQCKKCPWRKDVDPRDIPNGFCVESHRSLEKGICRSGEVRINLPLHMMACHESPIGKERPCTGWLANQLGPGNNLALRMAVATGRIRPPGELAGEQRERFEDLLPAEPRR